jgi:hypothetical protein
MTMVTFTAADLNAGFAEDGDLTVAGTDADTGGQVVVRFDGGLASALRAVGLGGGGVSVLVDTEPAATVLHRD